MFANQLSSNNTQTTHIQFGLGNLHQSYTCLVDSLQAYFATRCMDGENKFRCTQCQSKAVAKKTPILLSSPLSFALGINIFEWNREKIYKQVTIPHYVDAVRLGTSKAYYMFLGVIFHQGTESAGHYFSLLRSDDVAVKAYTQRHFESTVSH